MKAPATPALARPPHDSDRLGLPVGTLALAVDQGDGPARGALLAAAALLLAAAGAGGFVVGIAARRFARIA